MIIMMSTNNNIVVTKKFFCRANYANASDDNDVCDFNKKRSHYLKTKK